MVQIWIRRRSSPSTAAKSAIQTQPPRAPELCARRVGQPSGKLYRKVKHRARPKFFSRQRPERAPIRRRSLRRQKRGAPHTEHGLGALLAPHPQPGSGSKAASCNSEGPDRVMETPSGIVCCPCSYGVVTSCCVTCWACATSDLSRLRVLLTARRDLRPLDNNQR